MDFRFYVPLRNFDYFLVGLCLTLKLVGITCLLGVLIGIVGAFLKNSKIKLIETIINSYVNLFRNTPLIVQMYVLFFALPTFNIDLSANQTGYISLTLIMGAYTIEIIRGGLESIQRSHIEAAYSLGMNKVQVFRHITLPLAMRAIAPPLSNQIILSILSSVAVSRIGGNELYYQASLLDSIYFRPFEIYAILAIIFFILVQVLSKAFNYLNMKIFRITPKQRLSSAL